MFVLSRNIRLFDFPHPGAMCSFPYVSIIIGNYEKIMKKSMEKIKKNRFRIGKKEILSKKKKLDF